MISKRINNLKNYSLFIILLSFLFSNAQSIISIQQKIAQGQGNSRNYFENILDVNYFFNNGLYLFTQLEYSNPPLLGLETKKISDINNIFYLQYSNSNYDLTLGDLYVLHGSGLSLHTYSDQDVDYDNSITGIDFSYNINDKINFSSMIGTGNIKSRVDINEIGHDVSIENDVISIKGTLDLEKVSMYYLSFFQNQNYSNNDIESMGSMLNLLGKYLNSIIIDDTKNYQMKNIDHNIGVHFYFDFADIYIEQSVIFHDLIFGERVNGYRKYLSTTFDLFNIDFIYEYKDYFIPYLYNVFSAPPIAFRESTSILASRNLHTIDFTNEYGYQIEFNKSFNNGANLRGTYAYALHHQKAENSGDFYNDIVLDDTYPYMQYFIEFSNWSNNQKSYYRIGYDYYNEKPIEKGKFITAETIPMQYVYNFKKGNSITVYMEMQEKMEEHKLYNEDEVVIFDGHINHDYYYLSPTYSHYGLWTYSLFFDLEKDYMIPILEDGTGEIVSIDNEGENWYAMDFTKNLKNSAQISIFYGSQKGGLICANGTCVPQPDFQDGIKLTFRKNF